VITAELDPKNPPPLVPSCLIAIWLATGPPGSVCRPQPAENLTPVLRQDVLDAFGPQLRRRLDRLTRQLTTADLAGLVRAVDVHRKDPADLARHWLAQTGLTSAASDVTMKEQR